MPTALVTGSARGLGASIATDLAAHGWTVAGLDLLPSQTELSYPLDLTDVAALRNVVATVEATCGPVDALITVAGIYGMKPVDQISDEEWTRMLMVNIGGTVNACSAVVPGMVSRRHGSIVTISCDLGVGGSDGDVHYTTTKGAIVGFTRSLAREVAAAGVHVNTVAPGAADTPMLDDDSPWRAQTFLNTLPLARLVRPDEIAAAVTFLLENDTAFTGQVLSPNAGATI